MVSLEVRTLTKAWPGMTVSVDVSVEAGKALAIAGPSGCGKTTLLRMIAGLEAPDSGSVIVGGRDVSRDDPRDRGIGMVFQDYALFPHLDVRANIEYGLKVRRLSARQRAATAVRLLEAVGLSGFGPRRPHELSGGERQRVALARTLAVEPSVVLFDEPLSSLDAALRKRLRADLVDEQRRLGFTAVYVTHDLEEAMAIGDTLAVMDAGRVLQCAPPALLWERPASAAVARFMGSGPCLPVIAVEAEADVIAVVTAAGRFALPRGQARDALGDRRAASVFFGMSAAAPADAGSPQSLGGALSARCIRADFMGEAMDCLFESGGEKFTLRLPKESAPAAGESARFFVPCDSVTILADTEHSAER